jgi:NAD-dependent deacetylase
MSLSNTNDQDINRVVDLLRHSRSLLFITGAGISADSGLPTYRGIGGLYNANTTEDGRPIEELLSGPTFRQRPDLTWKYLKQIENACRGAKFNRGHEVIAQVEAHFERVWILTQNVDGFHRQAGSRNVIDIHGDLHHLRCTACSFRQMVPDYSELAVLPLCPRCRELVRPDVVLFEEMLPQDKVAQMYREIDPGFDLVFTIGTTSVFPYIAEPVEAAYDRGKPTVEINPGRTAVSQLVTIKLALGAAAALDAIWQLFQGVAQKTP